MERHHRRPKSRQTHLSAESFVIPPPPRDFPVSARLQELLGDFSTQFGCIFLLAGSFVFWLFAMHSDYASWYRYNGALETAAARATAGRDTP